MENGFGNFIGIVLTLQIVGFYSHFNGPILPTQEYSISFLERYNLPTLIKEEIQI